MALASTSADAATITVSSTLDGPVTADMICTLREALVSLSGAAVVGGCTATGAFGTADAINVTATGTITLVPAEGPLVADVPATITGPGAAQLTISGGNATPVLYAYGPGISVSGVTIANGNSGQSPFAGGVAAFDATISLNNCSLTGNTGGYGGALSALYSGVTIDNCTITGNTGAVGGAIGLLASGAQITGATVTTNIAGGAPPTGPLLRPAGAFARPIERADLLHAPRGLPGLGGGIAVLGGVGKGDFSAAPTGGGPAVTISNSTISGNTASAIGGGVVLYATSASITNSTISGNTSATAGGGAIVLETLFQIGNSTVSGNSAVGVGPNTGGGGLLLYSTGGVAMSLQSTTITGNSAATGAGGVLIDDAVALTVTSSILANSAGAAPADIATTGMGATIAATTSLVENVGNSGITATGGNLIAVDPQLGPLANNGGPTLTQLPATTSPVVNTGANPTGAAFDQRGTGFPRVVGPAADIGSVERPGGVVPAASFVANVPATSTWGAMLLAAALAAVAWFRRPRLLRKRR